ncbi:MAG: alpha/beta fold hydrolase [Terracidiphilus sp.]
MKARNIIATIGVITVTIFNSFGNTQTIRERIRERREAKEQQANPGFPAKGDLTQARPVTLTFDGVRRSYLIEVPRGPGPFPVLILLHGGTEDAEQVWRQTSLPTLARSEGFIIVAPNGLNKHWNDGRGTTLSGLVSTADDVGFLKRVIADVIAKDRGNPNAVFMAGVSNGGFMTMHFACRAGSLLRAASYVASTLPEAEETNCVAPPMPWLAMNGTADPIIPFDGMKAGIVKNGSPQPELLSADSTFDFWAVRDHCGAFVSKTGLPHLNPADPTTAEERVCKGDGGLPSVQIVFQGGGHSWPNLQYTALIQGFVGYSNQDVDAGQAMWSFFKGTL